MGAARLGLVTDNPYGMSPSWAHVEPSPEPARMTWVTDVATLVPNSSSLNIHTRRMFTPKPDEPPPEPGMLWDALEGKWCWEALPKKCGRKPKKKGPYDPNAKRSKRGAKARNRKEKAVLGSKRKKPDTTVHKPTDQEVVAELLAMKESHPKR